MSVCLEERHASVRERERRKSWAGGGGGGGEGGARTKNENDCGNICVAACALLRFCSENSDYCFRVIHFFFLLLRIELLFLSPDLACFLVAFVRACVSVYYVC